MLNKIYKIIRFFIYLSPFLLLIILIYKDFAPSGKVSFSYDFSRDSPVITKLFPANRLSDPQKIQNNEYYQEILKEPVYFETRLSQKFNQAQVELVFQNPESSLFQLGLAIKGEKDWNYQFKPIDNKIINNLTWSKLEENGIFLWQRIKKYYNLKDFLKNLNNETAVGFYNYDFKRKFKLINYQPAVNYQIINKTIRGYHQFYTYVKNEDLDFNFKIQDINRAPGPDFLDINVYNDQDQKIYHQRLDDDGYISNLDPASAPRYLSIKIPNLPEGVYKIELACEDEIFFREIKTKQRYIAFINRLYLVDNPEYADGFLDLIYQPTEVFTNAKRLSFETAHPEGLQEVQVNNQKLSINETHKKYFLTVDKLPAKIIVPKNDLKIFGTGLFSLSQEAFFNPEIYNLQNFQETPEINFLLTSYQIPQQIDDWQKTSITFNLDNASIINRKLRWMLSAPEMNNLNDKIKIKEIKITYLKEPISWQEFLPRILKYLQKFI